MNEKKFIGTWKLKSFEAELPDGRVLYPHGKNPDGYIMYSEDGYMLVLITDQDRKSFAGEAIPSKHFWKTVNDHKKAEAYETLLSYCGKYKVKNEDVVEHFIEVSSFPNWVGTTQERTYKFSENLLTLSQVTPWAIATLVWEKLHAEKTMVI